MTIAKIDPAYSTTVKVTGGRRGTVVSDDGVLDVKLAAPGTSNPATNPEQLFAAGYAACYQSALLGAAGRAGVDASASVVNATVSLGKEVDGESYGLAVKLEVSIPGVDEAKVQELADEAHRGCPYSRATRGNIQVDIVTG